MLTNDFNHIADAWIEALQQYDFSCLSVKPSPTSWSLGQLYLHLINDTNYYIQEIKICISNDDNADGEALAFAKTMLYNNDFPDEIIEGAPANASIPQPASKDQLLRSLISLKDEIYRLGILISKTAGRGKTKHPGFGYLNAHEWLQFAEMHFRHHLRQKKRIDDFLKTNAPE